LGQSQKSAIGVLSVGLIAANISSSNSVKAGSQGEPLARPETFAGIEQKVKYFELYS
jgi:hypothetical protein